MTYRPIRDDAQHIIGLRLAAADEPAAAPPLRAIDPLTAPRPASLLPEPPASDPVAPPARPAPSRRVQLASTVLVLATLGILGIMFGLFRADRPALPPAQPTLAATAAPVATSAPSACTVVRAAATFYAPGGDATGDALEAGTACVLVGWHSRYPDWRQITAGGAPIWVHAALLSTASTAEVPDLAPPPTPTAPPPPPATPRPIVIVEQAPPAPTQCATVRGVGVVVQRCGSAALDQLQADAEAAWRAQMQPTAAGGK